MIDPNNPKTGLSAWEVEFAPNEPSDDAKWLTFVVVAPTTDLMKVAEWAAANCPATYHIQAIKLCYSGNDSMVVL